MGKELTGNQNKNDLTRLRVGKAARVEHLQIDEGAMEVMEGVLGRALVQKGKDEV